MFSENTYLGSHDVRFFYFQKGGANNRSIFVDKHRRTVPVPYRYEIFFEL